MNARPLRTMVTLTARTGLSTLLLALQLVIVPVAHAATPDTASVLRALNAFRLKGCHGKDGPVSPLRENAHLSAAAERIAEGSKLIPAMAASDYRAVRAAQIILSGYSGANAVAHGAASRFCSTVADDDFTEFGLYQRGTQSWMVLAMPFTPPATSQRAEVQARVLDLVNQARSKPRQCGADSFRAAAALGLNAKLNEAASAHAVDMARHSYFSHTGRDGRHASERASHAGYNWRSVGENIAAGQMYADEVMKAWLSSPGHCANIMNPRFTEMGLAFAVNPKSDAGIYWVQVFGLPR